MEWKNKLFSWSLLPHRVVAKFFGSDVYRAPKGRTLAALMAYDSVSNTNEKDYRRYGDYARYRSLELVAEQINGKQIEGSVAEAGVSLGNFAFLINRVFHDRKLYLYDTFEGFDERDVEHELSKGYTSEKWFKGADYYRNSKVSDKIEFIKNRMKYPDKCVFRKGYFPETATPDEGEIFAFVSIDMDLYKPILAAMEFFYPRLGKGGYIFIHDYNNGVEFLGIKQVINEYEAEFGHISKFPLPDSGGTLVITK